MRKLCIDMDGVVADFDEYAMRTLGVGPSKGIYPEHIWQLLAKNPRIYKDLTKTLYADTLVNCCKNLAKTQNLDLIFLTAVPKGNDVKYAFYDKVLWAQQYFPDIPVHFGPYSKDKYKHCVIGDILIDDRVSNINEWKNAGGIAIFHTGLDQTLLELDNLFKG